MVSRDRGAVWHNRTISICYSVVCVLYDVQLILFVLCAAVSCCFFCFVAAGLVYISITCTHTQ